MLLLFLTLIQNTLGQNLIKNGGFENNIELNPECYRTVCLSNDTRLIEPWILVAPSSSLMITGRVHIQKEGRVSMHLNTPEPYAIGQRIKTKPSETYKVTLQLGTPICFADEPKVVYILAGGLPRQFFVAKYNEWSLIEYTFVASSEETFLEIGSSSKGTICGPRIDDVQIVVVPKSETKTNGDSNSSVGSNTTAPLSVDAASNKISPGSIVAIIASGVLMVGLAIFCYKRYQNKKAIRNQNRYDARAHWENLMKSPKK